MILVNIYLGRRWVFPKKYNPVNAMLLALQDDFSLENIGLIGIIKRIKIGVQR
jgi:hypothetical protein